MKRVFGVALSVVYAFGSSLAIAQNRGLIPKNDTAYVTGSENSAGHLDLLDERKADLAFTLRLYNYDSTKNWFPKELVSPLVKKYAIVMLENIPPGTDDFERFTVFFPLSGGVIRIIPLSYGMVGPAYVKEDPHNIAIFNEVISKEQPAIKTDEDRLSLAMLYLHFFYENPMVLDETNLDAFVGVHRKTSAGLVPQVATEADGTFEVELVQKEGVCGPFMKMSFFSDKQGMLQSFDEDKIPESDLGAYVERRCR